MLLFNPQVISSGRGKSKAIATYDVLGAFKSLDTIVGIIVDITTANTGADNGLVVQLESLTNPYDWVSTSSSRAAVKAYHFFH